jgi:hypothetical protein
MVRVNPDPYLVLGVSPTATQAEITHAAMPPAHRRQRPTPADRPPAGRVEIPITHRATTATAAQVPEPPLRAGPVRRHR